MDSVAQEIDVASSDTDEEGDPTTEAPAPPKILYKTEYRNLRSKQVVFKEDSSKKTRKSDKRLPIFEVVEVILTLKTKPMPGEDSSGSKLPSVHSFGKSYIRIYSAAIITALRAVVDYYPSIVLASDPITIDAPYAVLVHYEKELTEYKEAFKSSLLPSSGEECENKDTVEHLELLQNFVREQVGESVDQERKLHQRDRPVATFNMLWLLLRPGTDIFYDTYSLGSLNGYVIERVDFQIQDSSISSYVVTLWNMAANYRCIGGWSRKVELTEFSGEKEIAALDIFPCQYMTKERHGTTYEERRSQLVQRGTMYFQLRRKRCMWFDGLSCYSPRHNVKTLHSLNIGQRDAYEL